MTQTSPLAALSARARSLEASKIREVAELGMTERDVIPLWFGEGAWPTSDFIVEAAVEALRAGEHMYNPNNGTPALRQQICEYSNGIFGTALTPDRITVTPSGMQGLMLAAEMLVTAGDRVVVVDPCWPNITGAFRAQGGNIASVALEEREGHWALDLEKLLSALTPETKAVVLNSPHNPTGWTMPAEDQKAVLDHCRRHGIWIVADDVYTRLYRHGRAAPSFVSLAEPDDLVISVNSFSKCWSMTGWRLGWLVAPPQIETRLGQLTEFNTSCTAPFIQSAGVAALREGEPEIDLLHERITTGYAITARNLKSFDKVTFVEPDGAFYAFFRVAGMGDSFDAAKRILRETKVGLAPGVAFGEAGEGYLRLCYAQPEPVLEQAFERLAPFLS